MPLAVPPTASSETGAPPNAPARANYARTSETMLAPWSPSKAAASSVGAFAGERRPKAPVRQTMLRSAPRRPWERSPLGRVWGRRDGCRGVEGAWWRDMALPEVADAQTANPNPCHERTPLRCASRVRFAGASRSSLARNPPSHSKTATVVEDALECRSVSALDPPLRSECVTAQYPPLWEPTLETD